MPAHYTGATSGRTPSRAASPQPRGEGDATRFSALGLGIDVLYTREIKTIIAALSSPQPVSGRMFWVSTSWVANAKKYYEALPLPEVCLAADRMRGKASHKKSAKIRVRRGSDALPPWPQMNSDLLCAHGALSLAKNPKGKRRLVSAAAWNLLRKFYPSGPVYPASSRECALCSKETDAAKQVQVEQRERELSRRAEKIPAALLSLLSRKSGVPTELLVRRRALYVEHVDLPPVNSSGAAPVAEAEAEARTSSRDGIAIGAAAAVKVSGSLSASPVQSKPLSGGLSLLSVDGGFNRGLPPPPSGRPPLSRVRSGSSFSPFQASESDLQQPRGSGDDRWTDRSSHGGDDGDGEGVDSGDDSVLSDLGGSDDESGGAFSGLNLELGLEVSSLSPFPFPLIPGIYHLVPRTWMRKWRHHVKEPSASVPLLDCSSLLCHSHGLAVVPPHLTEFLLSVRKSLLGGLGQYPGEIVEIISLEEWEALHEQLKSFPDFGVRFCLGPEGDIIWNVGICQSCDPFNYGNLTPSPARRERPR